MTEQTGLDAIRHYVAMRDAQPMKGLDDAIHRIHTGTQFAAELRLSDLRALLVPAQRARITKTGLKQLKHLHQVMHSAYAKGGNRLMSVWENDLKAIDAAVAALSSDGSEAADGAIGSPGLTEAPRKCQPSQPEGETTRLAEVAPGPSDAPLGELDQIAFELEEWIRQPDWAEKFTLQDMVDWAGDKRPIHIVQKLRQIAASHGASELMEGHRVAVRPGGPPYPCNCRHPGSLGGDCDGSCQCPPPDAAEDPATLLKGLDSAVVALQGILEHPGDPEAWQDARAALPDLLKLLEAPAQTGASQ